MGMREHKFTGAAAAIGNCLVLLACLFTACCLLFVFVVFALFLVAVCLCFLCGCCLRKFAVCLVACCVACCLLLLTSTLPTSDKKCHHQAEILNLFEQLPYGSDTEQSS
ncbi:unnamed protein product [Polarella glacialis]|uniref:Uncharacterized protein n=1 Tax=Polarella glacialis TaxID=89957 RepID=A0A813KQZ5_POLGL|nr:unnamed protein product [Polarella glacialis]CAE8710771.1 unnamed protein product [Polarella glacialis]